MPITRKMNLINVHFWTYLKVAGSDGPLVDEHMSPLYFRINRFAELNDSSVLSISFAHRLNLKLSIDI